MTSVRQWLKYRSKFLKDKKNWEGYYICSICGKWCDHIEVDHIKKRGSHPELVLEESNLRLLCNTCHRKVT